MAIENIVQAIARDIIARLLLTLEKEGFQVVFHVHDQVVVQVSEVEAAKRYERFIELLHAEDPRCPGLPLAGEAHLSDRYTRDKEYLALFTSSALVTDAVHGVALDPVGVVDGFIGQGTSEEEDSHE